MAFCAIGRGGVPDAAGAAPRAVGNVVLLPRFAHPNSITKYASRQAISRNPVTHLYLDHIITSD